MQILNPSAGSGARNYTVLSNQRSENQTILDVRITQNKRNAGKNLWSSQTAGSGSECMYLSPEPVAALQVRWRTEQLDTETHCSDLQNQQRQKKKRENVS